MNIVPMPKLGLYEVEPGLEKLSVAKPSSALIVQRVEHVQQKIDAAETAGGDRP